MKTKKAFSFIGLFIGAAAALVVLVPIRVYQYFSNIEQATGFYSKQDFSVYTVYAAMLFVVLFSFILSFSSRKSVTVKRTADAPALNGCAFIIGAVGFIIDAVSALLGYLDIINSYSYNPAQTAAKYVSQEGGTILLAETVFATAAAVYFALMAAAGFSKKNSAPRFRALSLAGPLWAVTKLLIMFKTKISFINVSDLFIELFACSFMMLFLFYFALHLAQVDNGESYYKLFAYGMPGAVFSLTCFLPRLILLIIGKQDLICADYGIEPTHLTLAAMTVMVIIARSYTTSSESRAQ